MISSLNVREKSIFVPIFLNSLSFLIVISSFVFNIFPGWSSIAFYLSLLFVIFLFVRSTKVVWLCLKIPVNSV
jgi:hypothetical protein